MTTANPAPLPAPGTQIGVDDELVTVIAATPAADGAELVVRRSDDTGQ